MDLDYFQSKYSAVWQRFGQPAFLSLESSGSLPAFRLGRWMSQTYHIVEGILNLQAALLEKAPPSHRMTLMRAVATNVEIQEQITALGGREQAPHPALAAYLAFTAEIRELPYPPALVLDWLLQKSFVDTVKSVQPLGEFSEELLEQWLSPESQEIVEGLQRIAEEMAPLADAALVERFLNRMVEVQLGVWAAALEVSGSGRSG